LGFVRGPRARRRHRWRDIQFGLSRSQFPRRRVLAMFHVVVVLGKRHVVARGLDTKHAPIIRVVLSALLDCRYDSPERARWTALAGPRNLAGRWRVDKRAGPRRLCKAVAQPRQNARRALGNRHYKYSWIVEDLGRARTVVQNKETTRKIVISKRGAFALSKRSKAAQFGKRHGPTRFRVQA
jgi:hypothetical protein